LKTVPGQFPAALFI